LVESLIERV